MNTTYLTRCALLGVLAICVAGLGCHPDEESSPRNEPAQPPVKGSGVKKIEFGKNVTLEIDGTSRRVLVNAAVCLRTGPLEQLLCRKRTKEHEAVLVADVDARHIHAALLAAGAEPGSPVKFRADQKPAAPTGTKIKVSVRFQEKGQLKTIPAQEFIRNVKTKKPMEYDWVFAGSYLIPDPVDKKRPPFYAANDGDIICVANFESAMLDLPVVSSKDNDDLAHEPNTDRIPALDTPVVVILEPVLTPKKK